MREMLWFVLLVLLSCQITLASESLTVNVENVVTVKELGSSVVLPCWLSPPRDASAMEVRWYRQNKYQTPVLQYHNQKISTGNVDESFRNRSSLTVRQALSAGLKDGDVSLRLEDVRVQDEGLFFCYVSGDKAYNARNTTLSVAVVGSCPVMSLQVVDEQVNVSCSSCGWYPQPTVKWRTGVSSVLLPAGLDYRQETGGLSCVHSWVLLSLSDPRRVSCSLSITAGQEQSGTVDIKNTAPSTGGGAGVWKVLFTVMFLFTLVLIAVSVFLYTKYKQGYVLTKTDEENPPADMDALRKDAVSITLNPSAGSSDLLINKENSVVRDKPEAAIKYSGPGFPYYLNIPGMERYTSGRMYWEVGLTAQNTSPKHSWLIGVQKASNYLTNEKAALVPSKGFWFLCSDGKNGVHVNTEPELSLPIHPSPETIGVSLDYDRGQLSFYDAKQSKHLFTMKTKFTGEIVPIFNPGIGDKSPLKIIPFTELKPPDNIPEEPAGGARDQVDLSQPQKAEYTHNNEVNK